MSGILIASAERSGRAYRRRIRRKGALLAATALLALVPAMARATNPDPAAPPLADLWHLQVIEAPYAWQMGWTGQGVPVGIFDSTGQWTHPEFDGAILDTYDIFIDGPSGVPNDQHGTHVGATILGWDVGVAPGALLAPATILIPDYPGGPSVIYNGEMNTILANAMDYAIFHGVVAVNHSWGSPVDADSIDRDELDTFFAGFVQTMRNGVENDIVQVWAAGNDFRSFGSVSYQAGLPLYYPELQSHWLAVTSVNRAGVLSVFANACGSAMDWCLAAPGGEIVYDDEGNGSVADEIISAIPGNGYGGLIGTSMATPQVTGALAIAAELFPGAGGADLARIVRETAVDIGDAGVDPIYGWGLLNLRNLVDSASFDAATFHNSEIGVRSAMAQAAGSAMLQRVRFTFEPQAEGGAPAANAYAPVVTSVAAGMAASAFGALEPAGGGRSLWLMPFGSAASAGAGLDGTGGGVIAGLDLVSAPGALFGIAAGFSHGAFSDAGGNDVGTTSGHLFAYGARDMGAFSAEGVAQAAYGASALTRASIPGSIGTSSAPVGESAIEGFSASFDTRLGRRFGDASGAEAMPFVSLAGRWIEGGRFVETGAGAFSLSGETDALAQLEPGLGLRLTTAPMSASGWTWRGVLEGGYARLVGDAARTVSFDMLGSSAVLSEGIGRDIGVISAQFNGTNAAGNAQAFIGYSGRIQAEADTHTLSAGLKLRF